LLTLEQSFRDSVKLNCNYDTKKEKNTDLPDIILKAVKIHNLCIRLRQITLLFNMNYDALNRYYERYLLPYHSECAYNLGKCDNHR